MLFHFYISTQLFFTLQTMQYQKNVSTRSKIKREEMSYRVKSGMFEPFIKQSCHSMVRQVLFEIYICLRRRIKSLRRYGVLVSLHPSLGRSAVSCVSFIGFPFPPPALDGAAPPFASGCRVTSCWNSIKRTWLLAGASAGAGSVCAAVAGKKAGVADR